MKVGRRRGASSVAAAVVVGLTARGLLVVDVLFVVDADEAFSATVLVDDETEACSWRTERLLVLKRPTGRLLAAVAVVVVVDVEAVDPTDGGRGGRRVVVLVRDVAWDFVRACVLVTGDRGLAIDVVAVVVEGPGRDAIVDASLVGAEDMDLGLVSLLDMVGGRTVLAGSACSAASFCFAGLRVGMLLDRSRPKMPEFGLLLEPEVVVVDVEGIPVRAPVVPARVRVAVAAVAAVDDEGPNFGSLLGELSLVSVMAALLLFPRSSAAVAVAVASAGAPPLFPGCRSDRDRPKAAAEDDDDMLWLRVRMPGKAEVSSTQW